MSALSAELLSPEQTDLYVVGSQPGAFIWLFLSHARSGHFKRVRAASQWWLGVFVPSPCDVWGRGPASLGGAWQTGRGGGPACAGLLSTRAVQGAALWAAEKTLREPTVMVEGIFHGSEGPDIGEAPAALGIPRGGNCQGECPRKGALGVQCSLPRFSLLVGPESFIEAVTHHGM